MKAKNQQHLTSEVEAKDKLIIFVYEYLVHSGAKQAADDFIKTIGYHKNIEIKEGPGFLLEWWCVFWDLYCATPERRNNPPESSSDARAFHDFMRSTPMSPSIAQTSPHQQHPPPQFMGGGPRHQGPPPHPHPRGPPPPRMQGGPPLPHQHLGGPPGPPGPPGGFIPAASPRYAPHSGPQPPQTHMNQVGLPPPIGYGPGPDQLGPSPGMNRIANVSGPPQQVVGPPVPGGPSPMISGMPPNQQMGGPPPPPPNQGPSQMNSMQGAGPPPRTGSQGGWQGNFNVNSPVDQQCFMPPAPTNSGQPGQEFGGMMMNDNSGMIEMKPAPSVPNSNTGNAGNNSNNNNNNGPTSNQAQQQQDEYVMPGAYGQQGTDQSGDAGSEIRKLKESLESDANEGDQSGFSMDFADQSQGKW